MHLKRIHFEINYLQQLFYILRVIVFLCQLRWLKAAWS